MNGLKFKQEPAAGVRGLTQAGSHVGLITTEDLG